MGGFSLFLAYKSLKTPFFAQKYLTRYTPEMFFEEYISFKIFCYLRHCRVIPVQNFGSHIRPQPPGLGLRHPLRVTYEQWWAKFRQSDLPIMIRWSDIVGSSDVLNLRSKIVGWSL
jgi:hypothetical protein